MSLETVSISHVEILTPGTWNGDAYSSADLDSMVESFGALKGTIDPPVKLGHDAGQQLAQKDGFPAVGWITNLYRDGEALVADFDQVPRVVGDLINAGAYKKVSSEVYFDKEIGGTTYPRAIKAVAILGADSPAVKGLQSISDIAGLYEDEMPANEAHLAEYERPRRAKVRTYALPEDLSLDDLRDRVRLAIQERYPVAEDEWLWVADLFPGRAVYCDPEGHHWQIDYSVDEGGSVTLAGDRVEVERVTSWQALAEQTRAQLAQFEKHLKEDCDMDLKKLTEALGLPADATEDQVLEAIAKQKAEKPVAALTETRELNDRIGTLEKELAERNATDAVNAALTAGKLAPSQKDWAKDYALKDPEGFKAYAEKAPKLSVLGPPLGHENEGEGGHEATEMELSIAKQLGVSKDMIERSKSTKTTAELVERELAAAAASK